MTINDKLIYFIFDSFTKTQANIMLFTSSFSHSFTHLLTYFSFCSDKKVRKYYEWKKRRQNEAKKESSTATLTAPISTTDFMQGYWKQKNQWKRPPLMKIHKTKGMPNNARTTLLTMQVDSIESWSYWARTFARINKIQFQNL